MNIVSKTSRKSLFGPRFDSLAALTLAAITSVGLAGSEIALAAPAPAATTPQPGTAPPPPPSPSHDPHERGPDHGDDMGGGGWGGEWGGRHEHGHGRHHRSEIMMHAFKQLDLTDAQKQNIREVMKSSRPQFESLFGQIRDNQTTLMTTAPNDPAYAGALATAKTLAADRVQQSSDLRTKIYGVLTPAQKAKLPQIFADMKAKREQRKAEFEQKRKQWEQQHPNGMHGGPGDHSAPPPPDTHS